MILIFYTIQPHHIKIKIKKKKKKKKKKKNLNCCSQFARDIGMGGKNQNSSLSN